jgi:hypothetical protein
MKQFWLWISITIAVALGGIFSIPRGPRGFGPTLPMVVGKYAIMSTLVGVVWAIFFRKQLENRQVRLASIFVLVLMEAILFTAIKLFDEELHFLR